LLLFRNYGVAEGEADSLGDADSEAVAFFFLGEADGEASAVFFFVEVVDAAVVDFFFAVPVLAAVVEVVVASSFFCAHDTKNAMPRRTVIRVKMDFFIKVELTAPRLAYFGVRRQAFNYKQ
jgi:hypothetical protein